MTLPSRSVRETMVLLNEVLMWAWPTGMFLRAFLRPARGRRGAGMRLLLACLLLAGDGHALRPLARARVGLGVLTAHGQPARSEERRVGKECRSRWSPYH